MPAGPTTPSAPTQDAANKARAFLTQTQQQAVQKHPDLAHAYAVRDQLQAIAHNAKPVNQAVQIQIDNTITKSIAASIAREQPIQISERTHQDVRYQVAYQSAQQLAGQRRLNPDAAVTISPEHRQILVEHAEKAIQVQNSPGRPDASDLHAKARETAGLVGSLDMPKSINPFTDATLKQTYDQQQLELRRQAQQQQTRQPDRGMSL